MPLERRLTDGIREETIQEGALFTIWYSQIVDAWQATIADVSPSGADKGEGGKYLLVPPD